MKINKISLTFLLFATFFTTVATYAQQLKPKFGLRAGANFTTMFGPTEAGTTEQSRISVRIAAGGTVKLPFHERFGMNAEVLFIQKGAFLTQESENSFLRLPEFNNQQQIAYGYDINGGVYTPRTDKNYKKRVGMNVINGYIEVPVLFYGEVIDDRLELELGASIGFLVSSEALGTLKFGEADVLNSPEPNSSDFIEMDLSYKFIKDEIDQLADASSRSAKIEGSTRYYPRSPAAYYFTDATAKDNLNKFNTLDIGLQAGMSYYFTRGLRIGLRFHYSLIDITTNKYDHSFNDLNSDGSYITRNDRDANFGFQVFVGLQF